MFDLHRPHWPKALPYHLDIPQTSVFRNLEISALRYPERTAIIYYDTRITYRELLDEVERLAGYLQSEGVKQGDRVLLYMQNAPQFVIAYYAILRADAIVVPINPMNRIAELEHYINDTRAAVAICEQALLPFIAPYIDRSSLKRIIVTAYSEYLRTETDLPLPLELQHRFQAPGLPGVIPWHQALESGHRPGPHLSGPEDYSVMPYSSGTTGEPKGCLHTHRSVMATTIHRAVWGTFCCETIVLATLPLFHVTGMQSSMNSPIYAGATFIIMTRWDREATAKMIQRYRINSWTNIVTMAVDLLAQPGIENYDLSSLSSIGGGGAAMPAAVEARLKDLTGLDYIEGYGLTETIAATHINPPDRCKPQCLGIPVFDVDCRIIDVTTREQLGPDQTGEIVIHGPQVFNGYWNRPEETERAFVNLDGKRFFRTGDMGYYDEEGYFFLVDRVKRMINASGFKIWPAEVENLLYRHSAIRQCCVISTPHPKRGETAKAIIVLHEGQTDTTAESIIQWCKANMAAYKVPSIIEFREQLPQSATGKLLWRQLQDEEWARQTAAQETVGEPLRNAS